MSSDFWWLKLIGLDSCWKHATAQKGEYNLSVDMGFWLFGVGFENNMMDSLAGC